MTTTDARGRGPGIVYFGGDIVTMDGVGTRASALWVEGDTVVAVGADRDVLAASASADPQLVDLRGHTVIPGLIDAHCHYVWYAYLLSGADCSPEAVGSIGDIQQALAEQATGPEGWVSGSGYAEYELDERRPPTRDELDAAVPDHPAVVYQTSLHAGVVNSEGLRRMGLADDAPDPPRGRLGRDVSGRLDGRIYEEPLFRLMDSNMDHHLARAGPEGRIDLVEQAGRRLASLGITSCSDASTEYATFDALRGAEEAGRLPIRVRAMFKIPNLPRLREEGVQTRPGAPMLSVGAVKVWADGGMSSRTAAVEEPYLEPAGETGILVHGGRELTAMIRDAEDAGLQVALHAQGDRAIRLVLEALAAGATKGNPLRHRIEHGGAFRPELWRRAAEASVEVVSQPGFISQLGDGFLAAFGADRSRFLYPFRSLRECGVRVAGSSDAPVVGPSPFVAMRDATSRRTKNGAYVAPDEAVTPREALEMYTIDAARVSWADEHIGSLEPGKQADLVVVDRNPLKVAPEDIAGLQILASFIGGSLAGGTDGQRFVPRTG